MQGVLCLWLSLAVFAVCAVYVIQSDSPFAVYMIQSDSPFTVYVIQSDSPSAV